jgi:Fe-S-cluster containining protein
MENKPSLLENFCKRCKANCCKNWTIFVTISDVTRISKHTGLKPEDFSEFSKIPEWEKTKYSSKGRDHIYGLLQDERILQLKKKGEKCIFLKGKMCSIYPARPMICRLYPYWFKEEKENLKIITCIGYENVCIVPEKILKTYKERYERRLISIARKYKGEIERYKKEVLSFVARNYEKRD